MVAAGLSSWYLLYMDEADPKYSTLQKFENDNTGSSGEMAIERESKKLDGNKDPEKNRAEGTFTRNENTKFPKNKLNFSFEDARRNKITLYFPSETTEDQYEVYEGVMPNNNYLELYKPISNGFISIVHPEFKKNQFIVAVIEPSDELDVIHAYSLKHKEFKRIPFSLRGGVIQVKISPDSKSTTFSLSIKTDHKK